MEGTVRILEEHAVQIGVWIFELSFVTDLVVQVVAVARQALEFGVGGFPSITGVAHERAHFHCVAHSVGNRVEEQMSVTNREISVSDHDGIAPAGADLLDLPIVRLDHGARKRRVDRCPLGTGVVHTRMVLVRILKHPKIGVGTLRRERKHQHLRLGQNRRRKHDRTEPHENRNTPHDAPPMVTVTKKSTQDQAQSPPS